MSAPKKTLIPIRKAYSRSTGWLKLEAPSGQREKFSNMASPRSARLQPGPGTAGLLPGSSSSSTALATDPAQDEEAEHRHRRGSERAHDRQDREAVLAARRVVVEAAQEHLVDRRADRALGGLDQREAQVARRELDAEEDARDLAARRQDRDPGRVRPLVALGDVAVAEADGARQRADRGFLADEEAPGRGRGRAGVEAEGRERARALRRRELGRLARIDAHHEHVEVLAGREVDRSQRLDQALEHEPSQHRALVVDEGEHDRALAEALAEREPVSLVVYEARVERDLRAELLAPRHVGRLRSAHDLGRGRRAQREQRRGEERSHFFSSARTGKPSFRLSSIARSIGMRTTPLTGSTHSVPVRKRSSRARTTSSSRAGIACSSGPAGAVLRLRTGLVLSPLRISASVVWLIHALTASAAASSRDSTRPASTSRRGSASERS